MKLIIFRYSPRVTMMNHISGDTMIIAPEFNRGKYENFHVNGEGIANVHFIDDFVVPEIVRFIRNNIVIDEIESITTLSEEDIDWVGLLHDHFVHGNSVFGSNTLFRDKYLMRSLLIDQVNQPYFRLLESQEDIDIFWSKYQGDRAVIKPRHSAGSKGIEIIHKNAPLSENHHLFCGEYFIEGFVELDRMYTCDGYSIGNQIMRFFSHEYDEMLLQSFETSKDLIVHTNSMYWDNLELIWKLFEETKKVLTILAIEGEITPFHFEWFIDIRTQTFYFCEVGKRFGGGNIPSIIQRSFGVDVLYEYWEKICKNQLNNVNPIEKITDLTLPHNIAATYSPYTKKGKIISAPDTSLFEWTQFIWFFVSEGSTTNASSSVVENLFLAEFTSDTLDEYRLKVAKLRDLSKQFKYD